MIDVEPIVAARLAHLLNRGEFDSACAAAREAVALALEDLIARHSETLEFPEHPDCDYIETSEVRALAARYRQEPKETPND